jgi:hypothetical protein
MYVGSSCLVAREVEKKFGSYLTARKGGNEHMVVKKSTPNVFRECLSSW